MTTTTDEIPSDVIPTGLTGHGMREHWAPGERAWFEYHCYEGHDSSDAAAWYHSHQPVTVLGSDPACESWSDSWADSTFDERADDGMPRVYRAQWGDGFVYSVWEDELLTDPSAYYRPDPPAAP